MTSNLHFHKNVERDVRDDEFFNAINDTDTDVLCNLHNLARLFKYDSVYENLEDTTVVDENKYCLGT